MADNQDLHIRRLGDAKSRIPRWKSGTENAHSPSFQSWKGQVQNSLNVLFTHSHHYAREFRSLDFWLLRVGGEAAWTDRDQARFIADLLRADDLLRDALEELPAVPAATTGAGLDAARSALSVNQLFELIDDLPMEEGSKVIARQATAELVAELENEQRWSVLAESLDVLRGLGQGCYEKVALPLLLDLIRRQGRDRSEGDFGDSRFRGR